MGQIIKSLMSFCHFYTFAAAILIRFRWNVAQWFGAKK